MYNSKQTVPAPCTPVTSAITAITPNAFSFITDDDDDEGGILNAVHGVSTTSTNGLQDRVTLAGTLQERTGVLQESTGDGTLCGYGNKCLNVCLRPGSAGGVRPGHKCRKCKVPVHNLCSQATRMMEEGTFMCPKCLPFDERARFLTMAINVESGMWE